MPGVEVHDLIVVGAGPAGAAAALRARQLDPAGSVLLLDKAAFPRDKPCGDGIAPHAVAELAGLGAADVLHGYPPIPHLRIQAGGRELTCTPSRPSWVVPRRVLDARLVDAAVAAGALLRRGRVATLQDRGSHVVVDGRLAARAVIGADGANSAVRRCLGLPANRPGHLAIALRGYAPAPGGPLEQHIGWVPEGWPAYVWWFATGTGLANVGYGLLRSRFDGDRAELHRRLRALLPGSTADPATLRAHHLPLSTSRPEPGQGRVLLAGDAASLVNPLSGEGIYYALASGRLAAEAALAGGWLDATYRRALRAELGRHFRHAAVVARAIRFQPLVGLALRAAGASPPLAEQLIELGLGKARLTPPLVAGLAIGALHARSRSG